VSAANPQDTKRSGVLLTAGTETKSSQPGEAESPTNLEGRMIMEKLLLTIGEASEMLGVGRSQVYRLISDGQLTSVKIGRSRRVSVAAIRRFVDERTAA
jgi:excisionase family DNA binding protein